MYSLRNGRKHGWVHEIGDSVVIHRVGHQAHMGAIY